jgi:L-alanine-DL-glutamate epimerase-like enolase superfamily enzyme
VSPTLTELEWATAVVPLRRPLQAGALVITSREYCCVRATLASGVAGESFVLTRGLEVGGALERLFAVPATSGAPLDGLRSAVRNIGWDGAISRAASALRLAALDAEAREQRAPVWRLLGATEPPAARAAVAIGYATPGEPGGDADVRGAARAVDAGATCVKLMGGQGSPADDLARLAAIRHAVGDRVALALDVNGAWPRDVAYDALPRLAAAGVALVEEPWPYEHGLGGFDDLPDDRPELAFGEISASVVELEALAGTGCVEHIRADATLTGGAESWRALAPALAATGVALFPHYWPEVHRHLIALAPRTSFLEYTLPGGGEFGLEQLVAPAAELEDGRIVASTGPGFGFALDWERVGHHAGGEMRRCAA